MAKKAKDFSAAEKDEMVRLSHGNSASIIAERFGTSKSVVLGIIKQRRGKQYPWGEREFDRRNPASTKPRKGDEVYAWYKDGHLYSSEVADARMVYGTVERGGKKPQVRFPSLGRNLFSVSSRALHLA